jgi:cytochrome c
MSSFEWNKIIASVLTAMIVAMVTGILASQIVQPKRLEKAVYMPPGAEGGAAAAPTATTTAPAGPEPIGPFMAKADAAKGKQITKVCQQCHTLGKGEPNKIGPNLYGVMDEKIAAVPGYQFSSALSAHKDEKWDPAKLNIWLYKPQDFAKGTKMSFPGMPKEQERADVIAYLLTNAPNGQELLKEAKEKAAAEAKQPAGGAKAAPAKTPEKATGGTNVAPDKAGQKAAEKPTGAAVGSAATHSSAAKPGDATGAPAAGAAPANPPASPGATK